MPAALEVCAPESVICDLHGAEPARPDEVEALMREESEEALDSPTAHRSPHCRMAVAAVLLGLVAASTTSATFYLESRPQPVNRAAAGRMQQEVVHEVPTQQLDRTRAGASMSLAQVGAERASTPSSTRCHTAQKGEVCYTKVLWAVEVGIREHPSWYPNLSVRSSFREVQASLHATDAADCEVPCPEPQQQPSQVAHPDDPISPELEQQPSAPTQLEPVGATSAGNTPWASRCNPTSCTGGLTCGKSGESEEHCCEPDDWDCCGSGDEKFSSRLFCPSDGVYTVMCSNGMCMADEADCSGHGGVWYGARRCGSMAYVGCGAEDPGQSVQQTRPEFCSSMEECQCAEAYPLVAYSRAAPAGAQAPKVRWSCLRTALAGPLNQSSCAEVDGWFAGSVPGFVGVYANPNFKGEVVGPPATSEFAIGQHLQGKYMDGNWYGATVQKANRDGTYQIAWDDGDSRDRAKQPSELRALPRSGEPATNEVPCHTAVRGEPCFNLILWSVQVGIPGHPKWEDGSLAHNASFEEIQAALANSGNTGCPQPCARQAEHSPAVSSATGGAKPALPLKTGPLESADDLREVQEKADQERYAKEFVAGQDSADDLREAKEKADQEKAAKEYGSCHTTVEGEKCWNVVMWSLRTGIHAHPNWYGKGLSQNSSFEEVQAVLHQDLESSECPRPCAPAEGVAVPDSGAKEPTTLGPAMDQQAIMERLAESRANLRATTTRAADAGPPMDQQSIMERLAESRAKAADAGAAAMGSQAQGECGDALDGTFYPGNDLGAMADVSTVGFCCQACGQNPDCKAFSWGKSPDFEHSNVCLLKTDRPRKQIVAVPDARYISGAPPREEQASPLSTREPPEGASLYCFTVMAPGGSAGSSASSELALEHFDAGQGIFGCEEYSVFSNTPEKVAPGLMTEVVPVDSADLIGERDHSPRSVAAISELWGTVLSTGKYSRHDWTVKVDLDVAFIPSRLQARLVEHRSTARQGTHFGGCHRGGLSEALEVVSRKAVEALAKQVNLESRNALSFACTKGLSQRDWGEDSFVGKCLAGAPGTRAIDGPAVLYGGDCRSTQDVCMDGTSPAYSPFQDAGSLRECLVRAKAASAD